MKTIAKMKTVPVARTTHASPESFQQAPAGATKIQRDAVRDQRAMDSLTAGPVTHEYENEYVLVATDGSRAKVSLAEYQRSWVGKLVLAEWR